MSRVAQASPNTWSVTSDDGTAIGTLLISALGFVAFTADGKSIGGFSSMDAATTALENAARSK
jgi:hypothetical protein